MPIAIASGVIVLVAAIVIFLMQHGKGTSTVTPVSAPLDPYAANLAITDVKMSESSNLAGGKVTYIDGHIANNGEKTVTAISAQVLFRNPANEVAQNETQPMKFIRTRDPYVDLQPVSAAPLRAGAGNDFRLIFDAVSPGWNGNYPEIRIVHVDAN
jgi:hypothetical protein